VINQNVQGGPFSNFRAPQVHFLNYRAILVLEKIGRTKKIEFPFLFIKEMEK